MRAAIARHRVPEIVGPIRLDRLLSELRVVCRAREIAGEQGRREPIAPDGSDGTAAYEDLAPLVARRPDDGAGRNLRLENRRHGLWLAGQARAAPVELRRVESWHLHHR